MRSIRGTVLALATAAASFALAGPAAAQTPSGVWGCQATSLYADLLGTGNQVSPLATANAAQTPCADDTSTLIDLGSLPAGIGATALDATTDDGATPNGNLQSPHTQAPVAIATAANVAIAALSVAGLLSVGASDTQVHASCVGGVPTFTDSGFTTAVRIAGQDLGLDGTVVTPVTQVLPSIVPGFILTLRVNEVVSTGTSRSRNAVHLTAATLAAPGVTVLEVIVGQTKGSYSGTPCVDLSPVVNIVGTGINRELRADLTPQGDHTIASCSFEVRPAGTADPFVPLAGTVVPGVPPTCKATMPLGLFAAGAYDVKASAADNAGLIGNDADPGIVIVTPIVAAPVVTTSPRGVSAEVTPAPGAAIASCSAAFTPVGGGTAVIVPGTVVAGPPVRCDVAAPDTLPGAAYNVVVTAVDVNGDAGAGATTAVTLPALPVGPSPPTVTLQASPENRQVVARITPVVGDPITACTIEARAAGSSGAYVTLPATYDPATGLCTGTLAAGQFPAGAYDIRVTVTDTSGDTVTTSGTKTVAAPVIGVPTVGANEIAVPIEPAPGTTIKTCTITIDPAGATGPITLQGTYDAVAKVCRAPLPSGIAAGAATVRTTAVDDDGTVSARVSTITIPARSAGDLLTSCGSSKLTLTDVRLAGGRVRLAGAAAGDLVGKTITIKFIPTGKVVARAVVGKDGLFRATASAPSAALRRSSRARYQASSSTYRSSALKLVRRSSVTSLRASGGRITITGRIAKPIVAGQTVTISQLVSCGVYKRVASTKLRRDGTFSASFTRPAGVAGAIYRAATHVPTRPGGRPVNSTFTIPTPITLS